MAETRIVAVCSPCGHEYSSWFNEPETAEHMAEAHGMVFMPGSLKADDPPRWVPLPDVPRG